jgi:hypothetical protein
MSMFTLMKIKKIYLLILILLISILILFFYDQYDASARCRPLGYTQEDAEEHAFKKLKFQMERHNFSNIILTSKKFDISEKLWSFEYQDNNKCSISISVDSCGATDVGGMSHQCIALMKKK